MLKLLLLVSYHDQETVKANNIRSHTVRVPRNWTSELGYANTCTQDLVKFMNCMVPPTPFSVGKRYAFIILLSYEFDKHDLSPVVTFASSLLPIVAWGKSTTAIFNNRAHLLYPAIETETSTEDLSSKAA